MNKRQIILVDSDAFVAIIKETDSNHVKALRLLDTLQNNQATFLTSNFVFSESITVISQRVGKDIAHQYIDSIKSPTSTYTFLRIDEEIEDIALEIFKKQTSKNVSFVDCTNMALLKRENIYAIWSFDEIYKKNGFKTVT